MPNDAEQKRHLVREWLTLHEHCRVSLHPGGPLDVPACLLGLTQGLGERGTQPGLYVLVRAQDPLRPLYIGKSTRPLHRWKTHLAHMNKGQGTYSRWVQHLEEPLELYVIPEVSIAAPPLPGFPTTVGSVEYQLIGLAQDAYDTLLNVDGVAR